MQLPFYPFYRHFNFHRSWAVGGKSSVQKTTPGSGLVRQ